MTDSITQQSNSYYNSSIDNTGVLSGGVLVQEIANAPDKNVALYFDTILTHSVNLESNITDNWLENNSVINDCIALPPLTVTLEGLAGELVYSPANYKDFLTDFWNKTNAELTEEYLKSQGLEYQILDKLSPISSIYPPFDNVTQTAINIKNAVMSNVNRYKVIYNRFTKKTNQAQNPSGMAVNTPNGIVPTRLQMVYENLSSLRISRSALTVITPYATFENMYIQSITLTQDNLNYITDISVTLKQLSFSEVKTTKADSDTVAQFNQAAKAEVENLGKVQGKQSLIVQGIDKYKYQIYIKNAGGTPEA